MTEQIKDAKGRVLVVSELSVLQQTRLLRAVGPAQSSNQPYFHMVECAAMVQEIDGTPTPVLTNERQIDAAIERLGDEGMAAVMVYRMKRVQEAMKAAEDAAEGSGSPLGPSSPSPIMNPSGMPSSCRGERTDRV